VPRLASKTRKSAARAGKRYPLNMRTTFEVRQELERAATATGRSLAQEAEHRIQQTFQNQKILQEALDLSFGPEISGLLMVIGDVMRTTAQTVAFTSSGDPSIENWTEEPLIYDAVAKAVSTVFDQHNPRGSQISEKKTAQQISADDIAQGIAFKRMAALKKPSGGN
jgi:hypothetical protein